MSKPTTRRAFLQRLGVAAGAATVPKAPYVFARNKYRLRVLGTHVTLQEPIRQQAQEDLGIEIVFQPGGSASVFHQASTRPASFDLYEQWSNSLKVLWQADAIAPIDVRKLSYWKDINALTKTGQLADDAGFGRGDAPYKMLYVQTDGTLSNRESPQISFLPYVHNADSIGYNSAVIPRGIPYDTESWGWLLNEEYRGRVALVNEPAIGLFDVALAAEALGLMQFRDMGNMTRAEVDQLFAILIRFKKQGHFRGVWSSVPQSVEFMARDGVAVQSMFSPGVAALNGQGIPCVYAAPREGYRAWHGVMCLSSKVSDTASAAAYAYMDWWLSGWPGAFIARQGYYISTPERSRPYLSDDEWNYWYMGKPAAAALRNTFGEISVAAGETRTGGSYVKRFSNIAIWNTVMDEYEYTLTRWREFLFS